ncbi:MAG: 4-(cytidine 5'-diphospho)-2-C-methyl-D-erythritol kinase [Acidobacteriaceae bacterium]|jgi:4-diphosphocytidyl-2-C-methyl-D-erythritol kinase
MATRVRSYSKINLGLAIGPVRADGFHGLTTLYQTVALHDVVTVEARPGSRFEVRGSREGANPSEITLTTNHPEVPTDERNTAWRMVERALAQTGVAAQVTIHIQKELPVQGGLGAGSANAAAALIGLQRELGLMVRGPLELAAEVGSDVPLFLVGGTVLGTGHGEQVEAMPDLPVTWCVVAVPDVGVSTARAFQEWDERQGTGDRDQGSERQGSLPPGTQLTSPVEPDRLKGLGHVYASVFGVRPATGQASDTSGIVRSRQGSSSSETKQGGLEEQRFTSEQGSALNGLAGNPLLALVRTGIENDFEQVVFPQYPLLREIKHELMGPPADGLREGRPDDLSGKALYAALSGSGSALFGLYRSEADARAAQQRVQASGCKAMLTQTLPRAEYWRTMFAE